MSGQLVGEVLAARSRELANLSQTETLVLVAIAEKCHTDTRQGSVRMAHIVTVIGKSKSTAERALKALRDQDLIRVVKRGFKSHGLARAPIYELTVLPSSIVTETDSPASVNMDDGSKSVVLPSNPDVLPSSMGDVLDGSIDGSIDGCGRSIELDDPAAYGLPPTRGKAAPCKRCKAPLGEGWCRDCRSHKDAQEHERANAGAARRAAIKVCNECNEYGELYGPDGCTPLDPVVHHHNPRGRAS